MLEKKASIFNKTSDLIFDYQKFVIPASENKEQLIKLQGIQYEW